MQANMGIAGEFRVVVKRADDSTKIDTGYQKNSILNQGLDFFGGGNGVDMMAYCVIGSGNSQPIYTQNKLDTALAGINGSDVSTKYDYDAARDGSLYKTNRVRKYSFTGLNNVNVSELGLASTYSNATTYFLCTRALIKDSSGNPTTITVLSGEVLNIYYKIHKVIDISDKSFVVNVLDGAGGSVPYNITMRPINVGDNSNVASPPTVGVTYANTISFFISDTELEKYTVTTASVNSGDALQADSYCAFRTYVKGSYKKTLDINIPLSIGNNKPLRKISFVKSYYGYAFDFLPFQIRYGSVANDSPITKTNTQTLSIPIEVSWGRYEGTL